MLFAALAFVVLVAAIVIGVFTRSTNHGRSAAAERLAEQYVHALMAHQVSELAALSCADSAGAAATTLAPDVASASVQHVFVAGDTGRAQLEITARFPGPSGAASASAPNVSATFPGTLELARVRDGWCVREFHDQRPVS
jgi:hypothetical protein